jgi:hypothetical protein
MGDAGEGLIDSESRIQERMDELARERMQRRGVDPRDPDALRTLESLRLARVELERQFENTVHDRRRAFITDALAEVDRRIAEARLIAG